MSQFREPQLMRRYEDKTIRVVCDKVLSDGEWIEYKNEAWNKEMRKITKVIESHMSKGEFTGQPPRSYRLEVATL